MMESHQYDETSRVSWEFVVGLLRDEGGSMSEEWLYEYLKRRVNIAVQEGIARGVIRRSYVKAAYGHGEVSYLRVVRRGENIAIGDETPNDDPLNVQSGARRV